MKLLPASWDIVPDILAILKTSHEDCKTAYNKLNGRATNRKTFPQPESILLTPSGKLCPDATFVMILPTHRYEMHIHTLSSDQAEFASALVSSPFIDWTKSPTISCLVERMFPILDFLQEKLPFNERGDCWTRSVHITKEAAEKLTLKVPDELRIGKVRLEHVDQINKAWPHGGSEASSFEVYDSINNWDSVGLYIKDTDELVAWCLYGEYGGPSILQVAENHKRKGYGEIVLKAITQLFIKIGIEPHCFILPNNVASMTLFLKLGYVEKYRATWTWFTSVQNK